MNREKYVTLIDSYNELKVKVRLLVDTYKKIYKESSNPKYSSFKDNTYFYRIISFDGLGVEVELRDFYRYESEFFAYTFNFDKISMSEEELEYFAISEIEMYNSEKLAKEWGGGQEFDESCCD